MPRKGFLRFSWILAALLLIAGLSSAQQARYDFIISGAHIVDGTGARAFSRPLSLPLWLTPRSWGSIDPSARADLVGVARPKEPEKTTPVALVLHCSTIPAYVVFLRSSPPLATGS